ncbi:hypothetical protein Q3G72_018912 [Acer saccharum]|nr:hypothetical protein Q3G72_018912 [Acer saccharum]
MSWRILEGEEEWLSRSVIGVLKEFSDFNSINLKLEARGDRPDKTRVDRGQDDFDILGRKRDFWDKKEPSKAMSETRSSQQEKEKGTTTHHLGKLEIRTEKVGGKRFDLHKGKCGWARKSTSKPLHNLPPNTNVKIGKSKPISSKDVQGLKDHAGEKSGGYVAQLEEGVDSKDESHVSPTKSSEYPVVEMEQFDSFQAEEDRNMDSGKQEEILPGNNGLNLCVDLRGIGNESNRFASATSRQGGEGAGRRSRSAPRKEQFASESQTTSTRICRGRGNILYIKTHPMTTRRSRTNKADTSIPPNQEKRVVWNLGDELARVVERGIALRVSFQ